MKHEENCMCIDCDDTTDVTDEEIGAGMIVGWVMVVVLSVATFFVMVWVVNAIQEGVEDRVEKKENVIELQ